MRAGPSRASRPSNSVPSASSTGAASPAASWLRPDSGIAEQDPGDALQIFAAEVLDLEPAARAVALDPDPGLQPLAQRVEHALDVGVEPGAGSRGAGPRRGGTHQRLGVPHRELLANDPVAQVAPTLGVRDPEQGAGVA